MATEKSSSKVYIGKTSPVIFNQYYIEYYKKLIYFCASILADNHEMSQDIVQDVFLKLWEKDHEFESASEVKSYLYKSVKNSCIDRLRHERVKSGHQNETINDHMFRAAYIETEVVSTLSEALASLPEGCARIMEMAAAGYKNDEIAQKLDISVNTVRAQKQRALKLLRLKLSPDMFFILLILCKF